MGGLKSRTVYFTAEEERQTALESILRAQGYRHQLDQYEIQREFDGAFSNVVVLARNKQTGQECVIKEIPEEIYQRENRRHNVSEADAVELCKGPYVMPLIEHFSCNGNVYLVSKFAP